MEKPGGRLGAESGGTAAGGNGSPAAIRGAERIMLERGHRCGGEWLPRSGRGVRHDKLCASRGGMLLWDWVVGRAPVHTYRPKQLKKCRESVPIRRRSLFGKRRHRAPIDTVEKTVQLRRGTHVPPPKNEDGVVVGGWRACKPCLNLLIE